MVGACALQLFGHTAVCNDVMQPPKASHSLLLRLKALFVVSRILDVVISSTTQQETCVRPGQASMHASGVGVDSWFSRVPTPRFEPP